MKDTTPIYFHSATYAHEHGELDQYRASHKANIACKEAIEQAIADNYRDNRLGSACVQQVLQQFDYGRIFYVLANTVRQKDYDGRISRDSLGSKVKTKNFDGYFGEKAIDKSDIHYGWELGSFFVSGYTDKIAAASEDVVFLKNVGDKVTLWFKLNQNINSLNGKSNLSITSDAAGYDQYFETPKMNFGRGEFGAVA